MRQTNQNLLRASCTNTNDHSTKALRQQRPSGPQHWDPWCLRHWDDFIVGRIPWTVAGLWSIWTTTVMHTSRVSSSRYSASRVFFCLETASLYSSPTRLHSPTPLAHFPLCHLFLRHSTPLASTREGAALPDDPRLGSCSTRPLVCITGPQSSTARQRAGKKKRG
jgi:hypothetical protein